MTIRLYRTTGGPVAEVDGRFVDLPGVEWDDLAVREDPGAFVAAQAENAPPRDTPPANAELLPPISRQEVWAAGVTYYRSRSARMEESATAGDFYDLVYSAARPELFFKASPHRVVGPGQPVRIRSDAKWNVPEPELALCVSPRGKIVGYTIGNDMSSRDIEGENPLYLPQAKVYDGSCALGPCILLRDEPLPEATEIGLQIRRDGQIAFAGTTTLKQMKRKPEELVEYLFRNNSFPDGCFLLTGTGIVPPGQWTLAPGDLVRIAIQSIGTLENPVAGGR